MMPRWREMMIDLFESVPDIKGLMLADYGIPGNWTTQELWSK
jgi:hypothetical protein